MHTIEIIYCAEWHFAVRATSLVGDLLTKFETQLADVRVIPSKGGVFEVSLDGELIFSKKALHRHAEPGEVARLVAKKLSSLAS